MVEILVGWKFVLEEHGAQFVMTYGVMQMHLLSVHNLDSLQRVSWCKLTEFCSLNERGEMFGSILQELLVNILQCSGEVMDPYFWTV